MLPAYSTFTDELDATTVESQTICVLAAFATMRR